MQLFLDGLAELCARHGLPTELILVEWNPPVNRPPLSRALSLPKDNRFFTTRIVVVPPAIHQRFRNSESLQLFQMIAKNVGIARARGDFVLTTNVDLLFSEELLSYLSSRSLQRGRFYRADRYDVPADIPPGNVEEELSFCRSHVLRINKKEATYDLRTGETYWIYPPQTNTESRRHNPLGLVILGLLGLVYWYGEKARELWVSKVGAKGVFHRRQPRVESMVERRPILSRLREFAPHPFKNLWAAGVLDSRIRQAMFGRGRRRLGRLSGQSVRVVLRRGFRLALAQVPRRPALEVRLATNASGDFILMARDDWIKLRGYPEFQMFSIHLDSLLLYQAFYSGIREAILPYPIYHVEHGSGWGPGTEQSMLIDRLDSTRLPYVSYPRFLQMVGSLSKSRGDRHFNGVNWGLMDEKLVEFDSSAELKNAVPLPSGGQG